MGWDLGDGVHEGWAACVAPDGRISVGSSGEGMLVTGVTGKYPRDKHLRDREIVSDAQIVGWRGACACGWHGLLWERVASSAAADFSRRRDYVSPDGFADASKRVEDAIYEEWRAHVAPVEAIGGIEAAAREYRQAGRRLDRTVAAARATGASWTDIGRAVGISRQSAHERWAGKQ